MVNRRKIIAQAFLVSGVLLLAVIFLPLLHFTIRFKLFSPPQLIDPTAVSKVKNPIVLNVLGLSAVDYSRPQTWFETPSLPPTTPSGRVRYYTISLPRLEMFDVPVEIDGTDLKKNAVHYPGTSLPGSLGNTVVFGHSSLPYLYRPQKPLTIFNPLTETKIGDEILVNYDGVIYRYLVRKTFEVTPSQVEVLSQSDSKREITLITCVPLGTYWHRLIVKAELVN